MSTNDETTSNESADPSEDVKKQNPGQTTAADAVPSDDRHKVEKLAKAGRDGVDPDAGSD